MPTVTITKLSQCDGGQHIRLSMSGDVTGNFEVELDEMRRPLTVDEKKQLRELAIRWHNEGLTLNQLNTQYTNGVTFNI